MGVFPRGAPVAPCQTDGNRPHITSRSAPRVGEIRSSDCGSPEIPLHFHALLKYKNVPPPEAVAALWKAKAGDAQVEAYRAGGGGAVYVAKMLPYEDTNFDMGGLEHFPRSEGSPIHGSSN
jgi:hypothetical protein